MNYNVSLSARDGNDDYQYLTIEVDGESEYVALNKAINYYYETYWSNSEWRKDEFLNEINLLKSNLLSLSNGLTLKNSIDIDRIVNDYASDLRNYYGCTDLSVEEFSHISISNKIDYLSEIGCELAYIIYPKKITKFEKIILK